MQNHAIRLVSGSFLFVPQTLTTDVNNGCKIMKRKNYKKIFFIAHMFTLAAVNLFFSAIFATCRKAFNSISWRCAVKIVSFFSLFARNGFNFYFKWYFYE